MNLDTFVEARRERWRRLEALVVRATRSVRSLESAELAELGRLYQQATGDLALAQRDYASQRVALYLNGLIGRAHAVLYRPQPFRWRQVWRFVAVGYPQLYRQYLTYTMAATVLTALASAVGFALVASDPNTIYTVIGPEVRRLVELVQSGKLWLDIPPETRAAAAAGIMTNNIRVIILALGGGLTFGLLTLYVLVFNGLRLGAIFGLLHVHGMVPGLAEFIAGHGPIELSVIFLAGGVGLAIGDSLIRPGLLARREALVLRTRDAALLILGSAPLLVVAGIIEGFVSPSGLPWWAKATVGIVTGVCLHAYWLLAGRTAVV